MGGKRQVIGHCLRHAPRILGWRPWRTPVPIVLRMVVRASCLHALAQATEQQRQPRLPTRYLSLTTRAPLIFQGPLLES